MNNNRKLTVGSLKNSAGIGSESTRDNDNPSKDNNEKDQTNVKKQMQIKVIQNNQEFVITPTAEKKSLLDTALEQNQQLSYKCKKGTCGKCTVKIVTGSECLDSLTNQEQEKLKETTLHGFRLACQTTITCN